MYWAYDALSSIVKAQPELATEVFTYIKETLKSEENYNRGLDKINDKHTKEKLVQQQKEVDSNSNNDTPAKGNDKPTKKSFLQQFIFRGGSVGR